MKPSPISVATLVVSLLLAPVLLAQPPDAANQSATSPAPSASAAEVPRLIKFSGTLLDAQDRPMAGPVGVTFALYSQQTGGAALWIETQNVTPDASGVYSVLLGANSANGVPAELFASAEARWLEVQVERQAEQPRVLLVSVPYALKAKDAETLGGKPASAFVTTETLAGTGNSAGAAAAVSTTSTALPCSKAQATPKKAASTPQPAAACTSVTSDGTATANSISLFTTACNVESSVISQVSGNVGIGTAAPAVAVDVVGNNAGLRLSGTGTHQVTVTGATSGRLGQDSSGFFFASDTNGKTVRFLTNNGTLNEWMRITSAGTVGIGTATPAAALDVVGSINLPVTTGAANGAILMGGGRFAHDFGGAFFGSAAGNFAMTGFGNTGVGDVTLASNTVGNGNTAVGNRAMQFNTGGTGNTAVGEHAGVTTTAANANTTGSNNTFIGRAAGPGTPTQLTNATAIGANALVSASNALVLGGTGANAVNVGIGTVTPAFTLDVAGTGNFTGNTTAAESAIVAGTQSGSSPTPFNFSLATVPPVAVGGFATATTGNVAGVGGISLSPSGYGVGALNFSSAGGIALAAFSAGAGSSGVEVAAAGTSGNTRGIHSKVVDPTGVAGLFDNDASGDILVARTGSSGAHVNEFRVDGGGNVLVLGNFHSATAGNGIILKSPDGTKCTKLGIDNTGLTITLAPVTCPAVP